MGVQYIKLIVCNVVYGDSLGTDLKKRDGEDDDDYTGRPEMHPRFWQVQGMFHIFLPFLPSHQSFSLTISRASSPQELAESCGSHASG